MLLTSVQFFSLLTFLDVASCKCIRSFATMCDTFEDFENYENVENLDELMVGSIVRDVKPIPVNLVDTLLKKKYHKLSSIVIVGAINRLEGTYGLVCTFEGPLKYFTLFGNQIKTIEEFHFPILRLHKLSLVNNKIESIKHGAFGYHEIENIDLSDNFMKVIKYQSLPSTNTTKVISIKNNTLTHIDSGSFPPSLKTLNLDNNNLIFLQTGVLGSLVNLEELTFSYNNFEEMPQINNLTKLIYVDASHNAIDKITSDTFKNMESLKFLDLSENNLLSDKVLQWLQVPGSQQLTISLAFNVLASLDLTNVSLQEKSFVLYGNPWNCQIWNKLLKPKLLGHESECDVEIASAGKTPYCIDFTEEEYFWDDKLPTHVKRFRDAVRKSQPENCDLDLIKDEILNPWEYVCVLEKK